MSDTSLAGQVVLVTGAASGLGFASSRIARDRGATVVMADLNREALVRAAASIGAEAIECDVSNPASAREAVAATIDLHGQLDGLVNAAGVMQTTPFLDVTEVDYDRIVNVNLKGAYFVLQAAASRMTAKGGSVVLFSSTAGRVGRPLASHYAAAKAGILNLVRSTSVALGPSGIRVNAVCPGLIETPMIARIREERAQLISATAESVQEKWVSAIPLGRLGTPDDVAELVAFLLSDRSRYVTGENFGATGGTDGS